MPDEKQSRKNLKAVPEYAENRPGAADEPEVCPTCFGSGMEVVPGKGARPCHCRKQNKTEDLLAKMRIPPRYKNCSFSTYEYQNHSQNRAASIAFRFANEFLTFEDGLLLMGTVGVGKTHLSISILKEVASQYRIHGLFYQFTALLKEIQDSYNPNTQTSELKVLSPIFEADLLVLDELGATKPTDWVRDTMMHIINTRYNDKKRTIFTTNYPDERVNDREETLEDRIGVRLRSRLHEMCKTVVITGEDFRRTFDKPSGAKKANS